MDERTARLEAHAEHIQSDITEIKGDLRRLDGKIDAKGDKIDATLDALRESMKELNDKLDRKVACLIGLMLTLAAGCTSGFLWLADKIGP
jgi:DNA anti-recombination protein RmuC